MNEQNQILIYQTEDGQTQVDVRMENETVWLTQAQMAFLFDKDQSVIARHIANVFKEGELDKESNMQILHNTLSKFKPTAIYNLDVIISSSRFSPSMNIFLIKHENVSKHTAFQSVGQSVNCFIF